MDRKKVALVGKAPASLGHVPYDDESWEIWGLSDNYRNMKRWDRWFELHDVEWHRENHPPHWEFLATDHGKPLYLLGPSESIPHARIFPRDKVLAEFGRYFTNTVSYMIALAILEGYEEIGIYGVDMAQHEEYAHQRPSCEWMIGHAQGRGITVTIPDESDLLKTRKLYGYETHSGEMYRKLRARDRELKGRLDNAETQKYEAERQLQLALGGLNVLQQFVEKLNAGNNDINTIITTTCMELEHRVKALSTVRDNAEKQVYVLTGARDDLQWARQWC